MDMKLTPEQEQRRKEAREKSFAIQNGGFSEDSIVKEKFLASGAYWIVKKAKGRHLRAAQERTVEGEKVADVALHLACIVSTFDGSQITSEYFDDMDAQDLAEVEGYFLPVVSPLFTSSISTK